MSSLIMLPLRILGWAAVGFALGAAWKLGSYLVEEVMREFPENQGSTSGPGPAAGSEGEPLWRRKYSKVSDD